MATMTVATAIDPLLSEFREEVATTRRVLDRVPADKLAWKPHQKSMTLGQLALHIAAVPGSLARIIPQESFDVAQGAFVPPQPNGTEQPTVYHLNMMRPGAYLLSQRFAMRDRDVLYVGNARANQLTKFVQLLSQLFVPVATARAVAQ